MPTNHADGFENKTHEEQEVLKKPAPDGKIFFYSLILPSIFVVLLWLIAIAEKVLGIELNEWGVLPRTLRGLPGILLTPFIHADFKHLFSNSVPLLVMGTGILYFYRS